MKKIFTLIIALLAICYVHAQTSYYVDGANGNDSYTGTSLGQAWQTIQNAFDNAAPGSTVYIRGGTYYENVYGNVSGTAGNPITFRNYQNEVVILDGTGTALNDMLYIEDQSNLIIENITIQNKVVNYATGVTISCTAGASVSDIILHNLKISGINWTSNGSAIPTSNDNSNPLLVIGAGTNQLNAITNVVIDSCEVYSNNTGFSENISLNGNVDSFVVSNNVVHDNKNIGIDMAGNYQVSTNAAVDQARNGYCVNNTCYNNISSYATSGGIYVDGGKNIIIERNTSYGNGWGIEIGSEENGSTSDIIVRDNVIYNNKQAGLAIGGYNPATTGQVLNSSVLNNTFLKDDYSNSGTGEIYITKMSNCKIQNNIFYTNAQNILIIRDNITPFSGNSINYNCWYTPNNNSNNITVTWAGATYSTFSNYVAQTGMDANSVYANPQLTNSNTSSPDFHLLGGSACIDTGDPSFIAGSNETDYYGGNRVINSIVDAGAQEYNSTTVVEGSKNEFAISVYPNPFTTETTISINAGLSDATLLVYDLTGKVMITEENISGQQFLVKRGNLSEGIYFYKISQENKVVVSGKLLVN